MLDSYFDELREYPNKEDIKIPPEQTEDKFYKDNSEDVFLDTLPVVEKIVNRKLSFSLKSEAADLIQVIALRLWKWRDKYAEKSRRMSADEWQSFAARTAYNEVNRYYSNKKFLKVPIEDVPAIAAQDSIEGDSKIEVDSLVRLVWQEICGLTLRQKRALIFHTQQLVVYLLNSGISDDELSETLEISTDEWHKIRLELPLSDMKIAHIMKNDSRGKNLESLAKSIKKARFEARTNLQKLKK